MTTELTNQNPCGTGSGPDSNQPQPFAQTSTPEANLNSDTFLQNMTHTGWQVRMTLPVAADTGPKPIFAWRVSPIVNVPDVRTNWQGYPKTQDVVVDIDYTMDYAETVRNRWNGRIYSNTADGVTMLASGTESPQSIMTKMHRFHRVDMVYALRFQNSYAGSGIFIVVPVKHVPRGVVPMMDTSVGGPTVAAMMNNSCVMADSSKSREIKFTYPYEYNTEFQDYFRDMYDSYVPKKDQPAPDRDVNFDNWFVVYARGNFESADNTSHIDIFIDHSFGQYQLHTPTCVISPMLRPILPIMRSPQSKVAYYLRIAALIKKDTFPYMDTATHNNKNKVAFPMNFVRASTLRKTAPTPKDVEALIKKYQKLEMENEPENTQQL